MDQRSRLKQTRKQEIRRRWHLHVSSREFAGSDSIGGSTILADHHFCILLGILSVLHLRLALHHLFSLVQRQILKFFCKQTVRFYHLFLISNPCDVHE